MKRAVSHNIYGLIKGKEYYNKNLKKLLQKHNMIVYSTENEEKFSFVKDGTVQSKPRCGSNLLSRVIQCITKNKNTEAV